MNSEYAPSDEVDHPIRDFAVGMGKIIVVDVALILGSEATLREAGLQVSYPVLAAGMVAISAASGLAWRKR